MFHVEVTNYLFYSPNTTYGATSHSMCLLVLAQPTLFSCVYGFYIMQNFMKKHDARHTDKLFELQVILQNDLKLLQDTKAHRKRTAVEQL